MQLIVQRIAVCSVKNSQEFHWNTNLREGYPLNKQQCCLFGDLQFILQLISGLDGFDDLFCIYKSNTIIFFENLSERLFSEIVIQYIWTIPVTK